jgi:YD repeat-containing protein
MPSLALVSAIDSSYRSSLQSTYRSCSTSANRKRTIQFSIGLTLLLVLSSYSELFAQVDPAVGIVPFSTRMGSQYDSVDLASSSIHVEIPVLTKVGKIPFIYKLVDNSHIGFFAESGYNALWLTSGVSGQLSGTASLYFLNVPSEENCGSDGGQFFGINTTSFYVVDSTGNSHEEGPDFTNIFVPSSVPPCLYPTGFPYTYTLPDGSGYTAVITGLMPSNACCTYELYDKSGNLLGASGLIQDPDGMQITPSFEDTLGVTALTVKTTGGQGPTDTYQYTDANSNQQTFSVNYSTYTLKSAFGCQYSPDYGPYASPLPSSITTPIGTFNLSYEITPGDTHNPHYVTGRLAGISYPTGGSVSYTYGGSNNGFNCYNLVVPTLTRTVNDNNGNQNKWTYVNNDAFGGPGGSTNFSVVQTDPSGNQTVYRFNNEMQTEAISFEGGCSGFNGCNGGGTQLADVVTCYGGNFQGGLAGCRTTTVGANAVSQTDIYKSFGSSSSSYSLVETTYDSYGDTTKTAYYDWGAAIPPSGTPLSVTTTSYNGVNGVSCGTFTDSYIFNRPCAVTTTGTNGNTAQTNYLYNGTGHATQTATLVNGTSYLTSYATYNSNGTISTSQDPKEYADNTKTSYLYNGTGGCNGVLPTSTNLPVNSLSTSQTWNCYGGVVTSTTDPNGKQTIYGYVNQSGVADPIWRQLSVADPENYVTWTTYSPAGTLPPTVETSLTFPNLTSNSTADTLSTLDGLSRIVLSQRRTAPGATTFDNAISYSYTWGSGGQILSHSTLPGGSGTTVTQLDSLGRPVSTTDGGGGTSGYTYSLNDVLLTSGPAPASENAKRRQFEYDGLGRLKSVCELTGSANGGGTCAQQSTATGLWTTYAYDSLSNLISVSENAQSSSTETRSFVYDGLSRMTSETNPEAGTIRYVYDSDSVCGASAGDLVKKIDAISNVTCYQQDDLHRATSITYPSGSYAGATPTKCFVYDSATVNGQSMPNAP